MKQKAISFNNMHFCVRGQIQETISVQHQQENTHTAVQHHALHEWFMMQGFKAAQT